MTAPLLPTLGDVRTATLARCGFATSGNVQRNIRDVIDERIRSAQLQLYELYPWLINFVDGEIELFTDEADYAVPDDTEPGQIEFIGVHHIQSGEVEQLDPGIRLGEDNSLVQGTPLRYQFINTIIRIAPFPDVTRYDKLVLQYHQVPNSFVDDTQRAVVDGEALRMFSEILAKEHFNPQEPQTVLRQDLERFARRKQVRQGDGDSFLMGGARSVRGRPQRRNRFNDSAARMTGDSWRPW